VWLCRGRREGARGGFGGGESISDPSSTPSPFAILGVTFGLFPGHLEAILGHFWSFVVIFGLFWSFLGVRVTELYSPEYCLVYSGG
jgi:hypothetical protein